MAELMNTLSATNKKLFSLSLKPPRIRLSTVAAAPPEPQPVHADVRRSMDSITGTNSTNSTKGVGPKKEPLILRGWRIFIEHGCTFIGSI